MGHDSEEEEEVEILPPRQRSQAQQMERPPALGGGQTTINYYFSRGSNVNIFGDVTGGRGGDGGGSSGRGGGGGNVSITVSNSGQSEASAVGGGGGAASQGGGSHSRRFDLPPHLQQKNKRAREALNKVTSAAAAKKLRHSFSNSSPVLLPNVDTHRHLPGGSTLLNEEQNANIQRATYKPSKRAQKHRPEKKQEFMQLVQEFYYPGATVADVRKRVDSRCLALGQAGAEITTTSRQTKDTWIKNYIGLLKRGKKEEALQLTTVERKKAGPKPVFTPEVETDISRCLLAWLQATTIGMDIGWIIAHLKALAATPAKQDWRDCIEQYNRRRKRPFHWGREWMRGHLLKWGFSFREGTTEARKLPDNVDKVHDIFVMRMAYTLRRDLPEGVTMLVDGKRVPVKMIPHDIAVNADQGGIPWISFRQATWTRCGAKAVPLTGGDDKRQMTAVLASNARGDALPLQIIMEGSGEGERALPTKEDRSAAEREGFHYTTSNNHWANLETMKEYVMYVLVPYLNKQRERLGLPLDFPAVWIIDCWSVHIGKPFLEWMAERYPTSIRLLFVPANCTGRMQPCDLSGQRELKCGLRAIGTLYATVSVREALKALEELDDEEREQRIMKGALKIDTSKTTLKPLVADWHLATWRHLKERGVLLKGWERSRLLEAFDDVQGPLYYELAKEKLENNTLWANTVVSPEGVAVPARLERVRVSDVVTNEAGEGVVVVEERFIEEPRESEQDIADMAEERARCAAAANNVCICMHLSLFVCPQGVVVLLLFVLQTCFHN